MCKPQLIILSDIFGKTDELWMDHYRNLLNSHFELVEYDSRVLAEISLVDQQEVHTEFINGGIERAVQNLRKIVLTEAHILGFSIGGTIAWKLSLAMKISQLHLVSATRLRNESVKPNSNVRLYYGDFEMNGPSEEWFKKISLVPIILENESHECYKTAHSAQYICKTLLADSI